MATTVPTRGGAERNYQSRNVLSITQRVLMMFMLLIMIMLIIMVMFLLSMMIILLKHIVHSVINCAEDYA